MPLTIGDLVGQGYTRAHAESFVARENGQPDPIARQQAARELAESVSRAAASRTIPPGPPPEREQPSARDVRQWCAENGVPCSATGRIPLAALTAYVAHHP